MCARKARAENQNLPQKFWSEAYWKKEFLAQLRHADHLLKSYSLENIIKALRHNDARRIYSLGLRSVIIPIIDKIQSEENALAKYKVETIVEDVKMNHKPQRQFSRGLSLLQRLRNFENG